ncbi:MAG: S-methyl-5'-thioinosine phosphorylase [Pseudomonadota bacterium]|nr:MAG: S-methyl-5'-thioinosine phosphorylase [Pseudomonadota bacterium]
MARTAIIGGTGLTSLKSLEITGREVVQTPYGEPSGPLTHGVLSGVEVVFLARHGYGHTIPPHKVNYRANIWALREVGAENVIAVNAVGGISDDMDPERLVIPDQIIDYTWSRFNTYFEEGLNQVVHVDFTHPYCAQLREALIGGARAGGRDVIVAATYGTTQGPRLETAAEVDRLERDGCNIVGMTGMPEAALARELELCYACIAVVANRAAGRGEELITMKDIEQHLTRGMVSVRGLLEQVIPAL